MSINWAHLGRFAFYSKRRALLEKDQLELFEGREHCLVVLYLQMEDAANGIIGSFFLCPRSEPTHSRFHMARAYALGTPWQNQTELQP